jgi:carotenoid cleavage dioxygenase-like enzyme
MDGDIHINPFLSGNYAPIRSEDDFDLDVVGQIPAGLRGTLYRIGPNPQFEPRDPNYHWFTSDGMVHALHLADGKVAPGRRPHLRTGLHPALADGGGGRWLADGLGLAPSRSPKRLADLRGAGRRRGPDRHGQDAAAHPVRHPQELGPGPAVPRVTPSQRERARVLCSTLDAS